MDPNTNWCVCGVCGESRGLITETLQTSTAANPHGTITSHFICNEWELPPHTHTHTPPPPPQCRPQLVTEPHDDSIIKWTPVAASYAALSLSPQSLWIEHQQQQQREQQLEIVSLQHPSHGVVAQNRTGIKMNVFICGQPIDKNTLISDADDPGDTVSRVAHITHRSDIWLIIPIKINALCKKKVVIAQFYFVTQS